MLTASHLIEKEYYEGFFQSVEECFRQAKTFMIIDSPSGSGKTLVGVAASVYFSEESKDIQVVHLIWPDAVPDQSIYQDLNSKANPFSSMFFNRIRSFDFGKMEKIDDFDTIWNQILKYLFPDSFNPSDFKNGKKRLLLIIDEVPQDPYSAGLIGKLRDILKRLDYVRLCLSGTNSKAANMVGLTQGSASSVDIVDDGSPWAVIITRLPSFDIQCSHAQTRWESLKAQNIAKLVVDSISCSILNGGNSRLIVFAIESAEQVLSDQTKKGSSVEQFFDAWQEKFSLKILNNKFNKASFSEASKGLIGQLNLLLGASAEPNLADVLLSHHYAIRAIPDMGAKLSSRPGDNFAEIGGWLFLAPQRARGLGSSLFFVAGPFVQAFRVVDVPSQGSILWQKTVFPRPNFDCLLYLAAARPKGYFSTNFVEYRSYDVVKALWSSNSAGLVNFQNPCAVINTGSLMEVLVAVAIPNAAACATWSSEDGHKRSHFLFFICQFCSELGLPGPNILSQLRKYNKDLLNEIMIPRIVLPGESILHLLSRTVASLSRMPNYDKFDLLLQIPDSAAGVIKVRFEAKLRENFSTPETALAGGKLVNDEVKVGVLVLSNCCQFWGEKRHNEKKRADLKKCILSSRNGRIGTVFLINCEGAVAIESIDSKDGMLFVIQVPEASLHQR